MTMTGTADMRHDGDYRILRPKADSMAERMRAFFAPVPAKVIARRTGADLRTATGWKSGRLPMTERHWTALTLAYRDVVDVLFNPDQEAVAARLDREHHALCEEPGPGSEEPAGPATGETAAVGAADRPARGRGA